jgi:uncharacterized protein (UPF0332 family)
MNEQENIQDVVMYWIDKVKESLDSAYDEMTADRLSFSVNRIYYACFYVISALLLQKGLKFKKHSGVRSAFHQHLVKSGMISNKHGILYDELYEARQRGDYIELINFEREQVENWYNQAKDFTETVISIITKNIQST